MRYDGEHKARTRQKILHEAALAIRRDGPEAVGVAGIMAAAGLTHGGFYAHFPSKEALFAAAIDEMFREATQRLDTATQECSARAGLGRFIDYYLSTAHRDVRSQGCPVPALMTDLARLGGPARARFAQGITNLNQRLAGLLGAIGEAEPEAQAASLLAELVGALGLSRTVADTAHSDALLANSRRLLKQRLGLDA